MIDRRNIYDQPINYLIKQNDEVKNVPTIAKGDDYIIGCLWESAYFKDNYRIIAVIKIVQVPEKSNVLLKEVTETIENEKWDWKMKKNERGILRNVITCCRIYFIRPFCPSPNAE